MSIPEAFPTIQYKNEISSCKWRGIIFHGVAHVTVQMYGYTFKLPIFVWMLEKKQVSLYVHKQAGFGSMQTNTMNQNNCLGVVAMLSAIFEQLRGLNLNCSRLQGSK